MHVCYMDWNCHSSMCIICMCVCVCMYVCMYVYIRTSACKHTHLMKIYTRIYRLSHIRISICYNSKNQHVINIYTHVVSIYTHVTNIYTHVTNIYTHIVNIYTHVVNIYTVWATSAFPFVIIPRINT